MGRIFLWSSILFLIGSVVFSHSLIQSMQEYRDGKVEYAENLNYRNRFLDPDEWLSSEHSKIKLEAAAKAKTELVQIKKQINRQARFVLVLMLIFFSWTILAFLKGRNYRILVGGFMVLALACLHVGLFAPMLEISALERDLNLGALPIRAKVLGIDVQVQIEQAFAGDMFFYYQSKSAAELIDLLFQQKNWVVGLSILLFSVIFPLSKLSLALGTLLWPKIYQNPYIRYFLEHSGKWSMADVFVVAVFLAFLAFNNMQVGILTESSVLIGLYFFLGYCILSLMGATWLRKIYAEAKTPA